MKKLNKRIKTTGEIFTPSVLVDEIIDKLYESDPVPFLKSKKTFIDPACGDGEFLRGIIRKIKSVRHNFTKADWKRTLSYQIYGIDLMWDNVCDTVYYLLRSYNNKEERPTLKSSGFEDMSEEELSQKTPDEINDTFTKIRHYKDSKGFIEIRRVKNSKHYVEYRTNEGYTWKQIKKIVRANSLTEWDFESQTWTCKCCK